MNKFCILLVFSLTLNFCLAKEKGGHRIQISNTNNGYEMNVYDYDKFSFYDTAGNNHSGKIFIMNDSQFYFLDFFLERTGSIYHVDDIYGIYGKTGSLRTKRKIPLGVQILVAVFVPYVGIPYIIISEITRNKKLPKAPMEGKEIDVKIKGFTIDI